MSRRRKRLREKELRHRRSRRARVAAGAGLGLGAAFALTPAAQAADFVVDDDQDANLGTCAVPGDNDDCSLRDAVDQANLTTAADRILFHSSVTGQITLLTGELNSSSPLEVVGPGAGALTVSGNDNDRIFASYYNPLVANALTISGLTLAEGYVDPGNGGAVYGQASAVTITDSVLVDNDARFSAGIGSAGGGGVATYGGSLTIQRSTISGNYAFAFFGVGGGVYAEYTYPVTISDSTISGNDLTAYGGYGAGIAAEDSGPVTIERTTIADNGINALYAFGAGVATDDSSGGATIDRSTISGNTGARLGGGVYSDDESLRLRNSTVSGNTVSGGGPVYGAGGGVASFDGDVELTNSTVAGNSATGGGSEGGGVFLCNCSMATINNSILADNTADDGPDVHISGGSPPDTAFSLIEGPIGGGTINETVAGSNKLGVAPQLGPLAGNGGATETHALAMTSPAVDAGSSFGETSDQRGSIRPFDVMTVANSAAAGANGSDIGAFELQATNPAATANNNPFCHGQRATVVAQVGKKTTGTPGDDVILGTSRRDVVDGGGGNDVICARGGKDSVKGGEGDDLLLGGKDSDKLRGGAGDDTIRARRGNDRLRGGSGDDRAFGGLGDDNIAGGPGVDLLRGGDGDDIVDGEPEVDEKRHGGDGDDDRGGGKHGSKG